jgi:hypothetical protein
MNPMKKNPWMKPWLPCLALALLVLPAQAIGADKLDKRRVGSEARWLLHVDVQAVVGSTLFQLVREHHEMQEDFEMDELEELRTELGIDPFKDVLSVTLWGTGKSGSEAVMVVEATAAIDALLPRLSEVDGYRPIQVGTYAVHSFGEEEEDGDERVFAYVHEARGAAGRTVVLAHDKEMLVRGIDVLVGHAPNLAQASNPILRVSPEPGTMVLLAVDGIQELAHMDPTSQVARLAQSVTFELGELQEAIFARLVIQAEDEAKARQISDVLRGVVALASLVTASHDVPPGLVDLVQALRFESNGTFMTVDFRYNVRQLVEDLKELEDH